MLAAGGWFGGGETQRLERSRRELTSWAQVAARPWEWRQGCTSEMSARPWGWRRGQGFCAGSGPPTHAQEKEDTSAGGTATLGSLGGREEACWGGWAGLEPWPPVNRIVVTTDHVALDREAAAFGKGVCPLEGPPRLWLRWGWNGFRAAQESGRALLLTARPCPAPLPVSRLELPLLAGCLVQSVPRGREHQPRSQGSLCFSAGSSTSLKTPRT